MLDPHQPSPTPNTPKQKSGCGKPVLFGCLGIAALLFIVVGGGVFWFMTKGKAIITESAREAIVAEIESSDLPQAQRDALVGEIDRLADGFTAGEIGLKEMAVIMDEISQSPVMATIKVYGAEGDPIARSGFTPEEKEAATTTLKRFILGVFEERIPQSAVSEILDPLLEDPGDKENLKFRADITDAELASALAQAKSYADQAGIRETDIEPDLAREIREIIDRVLNQ